MAGRRIVVLGASFAGIAAAVELERRLSRAHEIVVLSKGKDFVFGPSLVWVPFGRREKKDISFSLVDFFAKRRARYVPGAVREIDLDARVVHTFRGSEPYDVLLIATGAKQDFGAVPGLGPNEGNTQSIFTWDDAARARSTFEDFLEAPGPVVIGAVQGASTFAPAYELALGAKKALEQRNLSGLCPITLVTPEPRVGHFGVGHPEAGGEKAAHALEKAMIQVIPNARVERVEEHALHLEGGRVLPFAWAMLTPPFVGIDPVRACAAIVDERGMVRVDRQLRTVREKVFAAGLAVSRPFVDGTKVPVGVPVTGMLSEAMGRVAAHNIVAAIEGGETEEIDLDRVEYTIDAGIAGHWAKVAWERYFLSTFGRGIR